MKGLAVGLGLLAVVIAALLVLRGSGAPGTRPDSGPAAPPGEPAPATNPPPPTPSPPEAQPTATAPKGADALRTVPCELGPLLDEYRKARPSPAYRRYVREQVRGLAETLPAEQLWSRLVAERDAELLALVAEAWVGRYARDPKPAIVERLVKHLEGEREPALRATLVRALQHTGEPSTELLGRSVLKGQDPYAAWVKDPAPEVRQAVVDNVREEAARNFGRFQGVAEKAVALAQEATDPKVQAGLLTATSIEAARAPAVATVRGLLEKAESPEVRAAAARALGTVRASEAASTMKALAAHYAVEQERTVRGALLEGIAHLGLGGAVPVLQQLRELDPSMRDEVGSWLALLASNPQTWTLLMQDKQAREKRAHRGQ
jgi:hypothetical protein